MASNVFVYCHDDFNMGLLKALEPAEDCRFHGLLSYDEVKGDEIRPHEQLELAESRLRDFSGSVDAVVGYWDFPVTTAVPLLCAPRGLPAPSLESVLKCEHKYWSRLVQQQVVPECTPAFDKVDPFDDDALSKLEIDFPFWIKPIKSYSSHLAFEIANEPEFHEAIKRIREGISRFAEPFNYFLDRVDLPPEIKGMDGFHCVAESIISGELCTVEGYVQEGEIHIYGVVDSIMDEEGHAFSRFQYPSSLPDSLQRRIADTAERVIRHIGLDQSTFNIEFFHDSADELYILEVNPRLSQSHSWLFEKVDGISNHEVMTAVALGRSPRFSHDGTHYDVAAKFFLRAYEDARLVSVPDEADIERLKQEIDGVSVVMQSEAGIKLSELPEQASYSYELADLYVAARSQAELMEKYDRCRQMLDFRFDK